MTTHWDDAAAPAREYVDKQAAELDFERVETLVIHDRSAPAAIELLVDEPGNLVCMATHGRSGLGTAVLGSVTEAVMQHARHPILLVGPTVERGAWHSVHWFTNGNLLVPLDGSELSEAVLPIAVGWASMLGLRPWVVQVVASSTPGAESITESAYVRGVAESLDGLHHPPQWEVLHEPDPAKALCHFAGSLPATLIAMTTHGRTGVARVTMGSVAMHVVHHSPCPVLMMRPPLAG
jgi:nucleotide-binding universal stress UspA family protein